MTQHYVSWMLTQIDVEGKQYVFLSNLVLALGMIHPLEYFLD